MKIKKPYHESFDYNLLLTELQKSFNEWKQIITLDELLFENWTINFT